MQVNSVSNLSANKKTAFGHIDYQRQMLESFANANDRELRKIALDVTNQQVNNKKHKRITNAMFYSIPLLAGLAAAVGVSGGRVPMLKSFAKTAFAWTGSFAAMDLVLAGKRSLSKNNDDVRAFDKKHPFASTLLTLGATLGAMFGGSALANKAISKFGSKVVAAAKKVKIDKLVKESKFIDKLSEWTAKAPSSLKSFGKGLLNWSPLLVAFSSLAHAASFERAKATQAVNNYTELKDAQNQLRNEMAKANADTVEDAEA